MSGPEPWTSVLLGLGANLGDRRRNLLEAVRLLSEEQGVRWLRLSAIRETAPAGGPPQGPYLNAAGELLTTLEPLALLELLARVEARLGRVRGERWGPRPIDLDLLLYGDLVIELPALIVPHPRLCERAFVLEPLAEIAPARRHPVMGKTLLELWDASRRAAPCPAVPGGGACG
jgi:2-amino-4-hydroxy-6-hydroxymethyldihydropteridine diphosphokinase